MLRTSLYAGRIRLRYGDGCTARPFGWSFVADGGGSAAQDQLDRLGGRQGTGPPVTHLQQEQAAGHEGQLFQAEADVLGGADDLAGRELEGHRVAAALDPEGGPEQHALDR